MIMSFFSTEVIVVKNAAELMIDDPKLRRDPKPPRSVLARLRPGPGADRPRSPATDKEPRRSVRSASATSSWLGSAARSARSRVTPARSPGRRLRTGSRPRSSLVNLSGAFLIGVVLSVLVRLGRAGRPEAVQLRRRARRMDDDVDCRGQRRTCSSRTVTRCSGSATSRSALLGGAVATGLGIALAHHVGKRGARREPTRS